MTQPADKRRLNAFVDGELELQSQLELEALMREDRAVSAQVQDLRCERGPTTTWRQRLFGRNCARNCGRRWWPSPPRHLMFVRARLRSRQWLRAGCRGGQRAGGRVPRHGGSHGHR
jgi:hypothetical protein